ncbi:shikimate dehydrogenase [Paenibacillus apis]|uniref:Shikimate dehydrogenase (NADP(+)) n=1 Tax=Paenibacillus apis TaxID=1792174 RepID=A0A920CIB3_9BACL|nr:shikimate dehydrogenase [Paenibacillus apis]GIO40450.1 shikimate dehydrogenase (NADP(+)) [Paenibacillus apis]
MNLLLGVMGDPVIQSKSPVMHQAALHAAGLPGNYVPLHVKADQLERAIQGIRALGFHGVNVTVPHKIRVMDYLDEIDPAAAAIGAVNTIVHEDGRLIGYNTDGIGYLRSLKEETGAKLNGANIVVLGAGGASRAIIYALLQEKPKCLTIANRTEATAQGLVSEWGHLGSLSACAYHNVRSALETADIIINTTTVGMYPHIEDIPVQPDWLPSGIIVSDLIYNPLETVLLTEAKRKNCRIHNGLGMFIYQGAYAFELWTKASAPVAEMRAAVAGELNKEHH